MQKSSAEREAGTSKPNQLRATPFLVVRRGASGVPLSVAESYRMRRAADSMRSERGTSSSVAIDRRVMTVGLYISPLDPANEVAMHPGLVGQGFLTHLQRFAAMADIFAQC